MHRLPQVLVFRGLCLLTVVYGSTACQHAETGSHEVIDDYVANSIDIDNGSIGGKRLADLTDTLVRLRGPVRSASSGSAIMYLSHDRENVDADSYRNCINLIIDKKLGFSSPAVSDYTFTGKFVLIDRFDSSVVHLTYKGVGFDTDCQAFKQSAKYPYFFVTSFKKHHSR